MENKSFKITSIDLEYTIFNKKQVVLLDKPQIVFAGKSNVGKSSLINSLLQRKKLAKISSTPGKTRSINCYLVNESFYLIDLPGFGYAKVSKVEREKWQKLIDYYLQKSRERIFRAVSIIDIRNGPSDQEMLMIDYFGSYILSQVLVLSKADKLSKLQRLRKKNSLSSFLEDKRISLQEYSSKTHMYRDQLWSLLLKGIPNIYDEE